MLIPLLLYVIIDSLRDDWRTCLKVIQLFLEVLDVSRSDGARTQADPPLELSDRCLVSDTSGTMLLDMLGMFQESVEAGETEVCSANSPSIDAPARVAQTVAAIPSRNRYFSY